jgi:hypothetical protein
VENLASVGQFGISINSSALSSTILAQPTANRLTAKLENFETNAYVDSIQYVGMLTAGDVLRVHHGNGVSTGGQPQAIKFEIFRLS